MNILRENIAPLNDVITVEVIPDDYKSQVEKALKELKKRATVPGFRAGHVPMGMINKMYKKSVTADEVMKLVSESFQKYLKENNISILFEPIALPDKTKGDFEKEDEDFSFSFEVGLHPEVEVNYEAAKKVNYLKIKASDEAISDEIKKIRKQMGTFSSTEEVVEEDMLLVKFKSDEEGAEEQTSSLLLSYINEESLKDFIGKKLHETMTIDTTTVFKSNYERATFLKTKVEELETAPQSVIIEIEAIHHMEPAELNEDFFTKAFPQKDVTDEAGLKEFFKNQIELSYQRDERMFYRNQLMETILANTEMQLPDDFIKRFLQSSQPEKYTSENIETEYNDIEKSVKYQLLEEKIAKDLDIKIEREDVVGYMEDYISMAYFGMPTNLLHENQRAQLNHLVDEMMKKTDNIKNSYENVFFDKMTNALKEKIKSKVKNVSFDEFVTTVTKVNEKAKKE